MKEQVKLGQLLEGGEGRDAVHVAVAPVVAAHRMIPGAHVGYENGEISSYISPHVGICDPFVLTVIEKGQRCYLCLYPNTVTSLRHVWTHPALPDESALPNREQVTAGEPGPANDGNFSFSCSC